MPCGSAIEAQGSIFFYRESIVLTRRIFSVTILGILLFSACQEAVDTVPPMVSLANPVDGSTVSHTVLLQAQASDDQGVVRVEFYLDSDLLTTDTQAPFEYVWDTATASQGTHTLQCKAFDQAGNEALSASVMLT